MPLFASDGAKVASLPMRPTTNPFRPAAGIHGAHKRRVHLTALLLAAVLGCSKSHPTQPHVEAERLGTVIAPIKPLQFAELFWSAATGEILGASSIASGGDGRLEAIHAMTGAVRTIDPAISIPVALSSDGSIVCYNALSAGADTLFARVAGLRVVTPPRTLAAAGILGVHFMAVAPDGDHVAIGTLSDSLAIHVLSTGARMALAIGTPLAFSPGSDQLLFLDFSEPPQAQVLTLAGGGSLPVDLGLPDTIATSRVHWTPQGIRVLYLSGDFKQVMLHDISAATTTTILTSADSLDELSLAWSPSGARVACWSFRSTGSGASAATRFDLHGVDVATRVDHVVAFGSIPHGASLRAEHERPRSGIQADIFDFGPSAGAVAFSPNEGELAYAFNGRLYRGSW